MLHCRKIRWSLDRLSTYQVSCSCLVKDAVLNLFSAKTIGNGEDVLLSVELTHEDQYITCYVMCDEIGRVV